jgi:RHS repeat-associated protein
LKTVFPRQKDVNPFGSVLPNRHGSSDSYRYGFNGKEKDDEVKGEGAQYDYGFRIYDPKLGKFLSQDPLFASYPWLTPYQFAGNSPIWAIDLDGLESRIVTIWNGGQKVIRKGEYEVEHGNGSWQQLKTSYYTAFANNEGWKTGKQSYHGSTSGWNGPANGTLTIDATGSAAKISFFKAGKMEAFKESLSSGKQAAKDLFISPTDSRGKAFKETFWTFTGSVATAPLSGGFAITKINKITPFVFAKQSFQMGLIKTGISAGSQYIINDNINFVGALSDGYLTTGTGSFIGSAFEINYDFKNDSFSRKLIFGKGEHSKSMQDFSIEFGTSLFFGSRNDYFGKHINASETEGLAKGLATGMLEASGQLGNYGTQTGIKEK